MVKLRLWVQSKGGRQHCPACHDALILNAWNRDDLGGRLPTLPKIIAIWGNSCLQLLAKPRFPGNRDDRCRGGTAATIMAAGGGRRAAGGGSAGGVDRVGGEL